MVSRKGNTQSAIDQIDDADLLVQLKNSEEKAFEVIYRRYVSELFSFCRRSINDRNDCEEIIQDIFESLWTRRGELEISSLRHYLFNSVRYKIIRYFQHNSVKRKYADHFRFFEITYDSTEKAEELDVQLLRERMDACVESLPERCKTAFRLRLYENLSNGEIAERMNITRKTVEVYIFKTFSHLRSSCGRILQN